MTAGLNLFQGTHEKGKNERPHDDAQSGAKKIIPEPDLGQPHAKVHRGKGGINQTQIKHRRKAVPFNGIIVFSQAIADHGSRVDIRSVSLVGKSDVGMNAKRIRKYLKELKQTG